MPAYPQLSTGTLAQWPLAKQWLKRQAGVETPSGAWFPLFDGAAGEVEWRLRYNALTKAEMEALRDFFIAAEGRRQSFTFVDPLANLLKWSEDLSQAEWSNTGIAWAAGADDLFGGTSAFSISGVGELKQVVAGPAEYRYSFSAWAMGAAGSKIRLRCGTAEKAFELGPDWRRAWASGFGNAETQDVECALALDGGGGVKIYGLQLEAQPAPSDYKRSGGSAAVFPRSRFAESGLRVTALAPDCYEAAVRIVSPIVE
jgi:hypothetical protein